MGQKPFAEKNGFLNILKHGVGAVNIDGCRIRGESTVRPRAATDFGLINDDGWVPTPGTNGSDQGRWPANLVHDGSEGVTAIFPAQAGAAAKAGNMPAATQAFDKMGATCNTCHELHLEKR